MLCFYFHFSLSLLWFLLWSTVYLRACSLKYTNLWFFFQFSICYWFLTSYCCCQKRYFAWFLSFKFYCNLICGLTYIQEMSHVHLGKCVFCCWAGFCMFFRSSSYTVLFKSFTFLISPGCSIHYCEWGIEVSNYYCTSMCISTFNSGHFCFRYFDGQLLRVQILLTAISSWSIEHFLIYNVLCLL